MVADNKIRFDDYCAGQTTFGLQSGSPPGRIRICDTRFRKSRVPGPYVCYQRLQFAARRTTPVLRHGLRSFRTTIRTTDLMVTIGWGGVAAVGGWFGFGIGPVVAA